MGSPYKRRKPALLRNFWVYRYLIVAAMVLGVMLWFILINNTPVTVTFPFRLGQVQSTAGLLMLLSALTGSVVTALIVTLLLTVRKLRSPREDSESDAAPGLTGERPPTDYAAKTTEGFSDAPWSR